MLKLRQNCKYALVAPTSMGVRITPTDHNPVHVADTYTMQATSAESNVLSVGAALGLPTAVLTAFVADSPIAQFIKGDLRRRGIDYKGAEVQQGGPWGYRHQFNIADTGYGMRGPRVHNDRAGEVGRTLSADSFDLKRIFEDEGVQIIHISGLIAALSQSTAQLCTELARVAKANGTAVSFDLNYRASFWKGRESELSQAFEQIASLSDILIGNEEDFQLALGFEGPEAGGKEVAAKLDGFKDMIRQAQKRYPNASVFATTLREVVNANSHLWGAVGCFDGQWESVEP